MREEPGKQGGNAGLVLVVATIVVVLPVLYVLSIGPLVWLDSQGGFGKSTQEVLGVIYFPIGMAVEYEVPIIGPAIETYIDWCDR